MLFYIIQSGEWPVWRGADSSENDSSGPSELRLVVLAMSVGWRGELVVTSGNGADSSDSEADSVELSRENKRSDGPMAPVRLESGFGASASN